VLAVGDAQFQKKCLGKMEQIGHDGRTIIFVSHNVHAVRKLCSHAVLLEAGRLTAFGLSAPVTDLYFQKTNDGVSATGLAELISRLPYDPAFELESIKLSQQGRPVAGIIQNGLPLDVTVGYRIRQATTGMRVFIDMQDDQGSILFRSFHDDDQHEITRTDPGTYTSTVTIPANLLAAYPHLLCVKATVFNDRYTIPEDGICIPLQVEQTSPMNLGYIEGRAVGRFALPLQWKTHLVAAEREVAVAHA
jgi:lipopolysaccharide transport system ATP-binding protein